MAVRSKKQINNAENHLIVGSIEVLGDIKGGSMQTIKRNVETLQTQYKAISGRTKNYWSELSNDEIITPVEKLLLKKEFETIEVTHSALMSEARSAGIEELTTIVAYDNAYNALRTYLYTTLGLFDEMSQNTEIDDRETFNGYYSDYYSNENFIQTALAIGTIGSIDIIVVDNLNFAGTEGQVVIYNGDLYQYLNGRWHILGFDGYCGVLSAPPASETEGFYFLARNDFYGNVDLVSPEGMYLVGPENKRLCIEQKYEGAYIYECINKHWVKVADKNDNRYVACLFDYYLLTGQFPPIIQGELDNITEELDEKIEHIPEYLGARDTIPAIAFEGDWFLWTGATITSGTTTLQKGYIYIYTKNVTEEYYTWEQLNPADTHNSTYYMGCLDDILTLTDVIAMGTFGVIFASAFFGHSATIDALKTKTIVLTGEDGLIKSELYTAGSTTQKGFVLRSDGSFDLSYGGSTSKVSGSDCEFINSRATNLIVEKGLFTDSCEFRGNIYSGPLTLSDETPEARIITYTESDSPYRLNTSNSIRGPLIGMFGEISFRYYQCSYSKYSAYPDETYQATIKLYDENRNLIYTKNYGPDYENRLHLGVIVTLQEIMHEGSKTFKLTDLPNTQPGEAGIIYISNGFLKIS